MKKLQAPVAGILLLLAATSCRKDVGENITPETPENNVVAIEAKTEGISESGWSQGSSWNSVEQPSHTVFYTNITAEAITADAADKGMVMVYKSGDAGQPVSLPFEETKGSQKLYWYYQVTEGNVMIAVDVYGDKSNPAQSAEFKHVVLNENAVAAFEKTGTTRADLMKLSSEQILEAGK